MFHALQAFDSRMNEGFYKFCVGHECAVFLVNELSLRVTAPIMVFNCFALIQPPLRAPTPETHKRNFGINSLL